MDVILAEPKPVSRFAERVGLLGTERAFQLVSVVREVEAERGERVIRCNLGQPDFPLPTHIRRAVQRALDQGHTGYCDAQGLPELRTAIARDVGARRRLDVDPERVVVFPGARTPIGFAYLAYVEPGDEVVYPSPGYPLFESFAEAFGAVPRPLLLDSASDFRVHPAALAELLTERTRLVFLNDPSNPTGGVVGRDGLRELADTILARAPADVRVYSDESYEAIVFDGLEHASIASCPGMEARTIIASGASKTYSWTGGRVGWAIYPTVEEARVQRKLNINFFASLPPYNQIGARVALESPESAPAVRRMVEAFQERRDALVPELDRIPGVRCPVPRGAFYLFPDVSEALEALGAVKAHRRLPPGLGEATSPSTLFTLFLLYRYGVATMDRRSFGVRGSRNQHYVRISIATGLDDLREAAARIAAALGDRDGFEKFVRTAPRLTL